MEFVVLVCINFFLDMNVVFLEMKSQCLLFILKNYTVLMKASKLHGQFIEFIHGRINEFRSVNKNII